LPLPPNATTVKCHLCRRCLTIASPLSIATTIEFHCHCHPPLPPLLLPSITAIKAAGVGVEYNNHLAIASP